MAQQPGESAGRRRASGAGAGDQARHLAASMTTAAGVAPAAPGGVGSGQAGVLVGEGVRRGRRAASCPGGQLEATAGAGAEASFPAERRGEGNATQPVARVVGGDPSGPRQASAAAAREEQPPPPPMSLPVLLPGISCPVPGLAPACPSPGASAGSLSTAAADPPLPPLRFGGCSPSLPQYRNPRPTATAPGAGLLPRRPLLPLGLLQVVLGCSVVALNFRALSLSSGPQVKNAYSFWAGSSVSHGRGPAAGQQPAPAPAGSVPVRGPGGRQRLLPAPAERWETRRETRRASAELGVHGTSKAELLSPRHVCSHCSNSEEQLSLTWK